MSGSICRYALLIYFFAFYLSQCSPVQKEEEEEEKKTSLEIISISKVPAPDQGPYPHGVSISLCRTNEDEKILVAIPAFRDRKMLKEFLSLKPGAKIKVELLLPWDQRPTSARAVAIANDFEDEYDLKLYFGQQTEKE